MPKWFLKLFGIGDAIVSIQLYNLRVQSSSNHMKSLYLVFLACYSRKACPRPDRRAGNHFIFNKIQTVDAGSSPA